MRIPTLRFPLSAVILTSLISLPFGNTEFRIKNDRAGLYRTAALEPPPMAELTRDAVIRMIENGAAQSLVMTEGGLRGWVANVDLLAMTTASGSKFKLGDQKVSGGGEYGHSEITLVPQNLSIEVESLDRSFLGEVVEPIDREQVEMRHDEN